VPHQDMQRVMFAQQQQQQQQQQQSGAAWGGGSNGHNVRAPLTLVRFESSVLHCTLFGSHGGVCVCVVHF
jgi:hypothetical protein